MGSRIRREIGKLFDVAPQERLKLFFLALLYFLVVGAYTITRDLKSSIFLATVGKEYAPWVRVFSMVMLVPAIFFYSKLVDKIRRYQLLIFYSVFFCLVNFIFVYCIGHPTVGLSNTDVRFDRWFGWLFYFFVEGYSPFVVSVFWSLANSINSPNEAKRNYGYMVAGSKIGGIITAIFSWYICSLSAKAVYPFLTHVVAHQVLLIVASLFLAFVPIVAILFMRIVPGHLLHGYEAAYQVEKHKEEEVKPKVSMFAGLEMFARYPYVFGIFGMVFFYETISVVLSYLRLSVIHAASSSISEMSMGFFEMALKAHVIGLVISLVGTQALLARLGTRICLMLIPFVSGICCFYLMFETSPQTLKNIFVIFQAFNYSFFMPVRESLFLPTVKDIKFKSKAWIDAFGSKIAKVSGSMFNVFALKMGAMLMMPVYSFFFATVITTWFLMTFFLGRRFEQVVSNNEVIGSDKENKEGSAV